jgi:hypothetical protein
MNIDKLNRKKEYLKRTALNKLIKMCHPKYKFGFTYYPNEGSFGEQAWREVERIIENLQIELDNIKKEKENGKEKSY